MASTPSQLICLTWAAVGAEPMGYLLNLGLPPDMKIVDFVQLLTGVKRALELYKVGLSGGDTKEHPLLNIVGVTVGTVKRGRELLRCSAKPGQYVHYCGPGLGLAPSAFLEFGFDHTSEAGGDREVLRSVLVSPVAQFEFARKLTPDCACIDNSDGVVGSLLEFVRESEIGSFAPHVPAVCTPRYGTGRCALSKGSFAFSLGIGRRFWSAFHTSRRTHSGRHADRIS